VIFLALLIAVHLAKAQAAMPARGLLAQIVFPPTQDVLAESPLSPIPLQKAHLKRQE
jgi:hypothetical protein